jgi:hypothetical protein
LLSAVCFAVGSYANWSFGVYFYASVADIARGLVVEPLARNLLGMSRKDESDFRVRPGRGRKEGGGAIGRGPARARSFVSQVMAAASKAGGRRVVQNSRILDETSCESIFF